MAQGVRPLSRRYIESYLFDDEILSKLCAHVGHPERTQEFLAEKAKLLEVRFSFLFMRANGGQLKEITSLINSGTIKPVMDKVFPFGSTKEALAYVESGRAKGKVVVKMK